MDIFKLIKSLFNFTLIKSVKLGEGVSEGTKNALSDIV